jgi:hypothetical protein
MYGERFWIFTECGDAHGHDALDVGYNLDETAFATMLVVLSLIRQPVCYSHHRQQIYSPVVHELGFYQWNR